MQDNDKIELSYEEAAQELRQILQQLETGQVNLDELETLVKRATTLIDHCQKRLESIDGNINEILTSFN